EAVIFVAVLGASSYTYAEATWTQSLPDWIGSHVRTLAALGGVPEIVVPDNLKAAVPRAHRYEPVLNRTYTDLAQHSGFAVIPALRPLPAPPYEYAEWKLARVNIDYHVEVEGHYYSVPYALVRQQLDVRLSASVVELFAKGKRVASHLRSPHKGRHSTVAAHMP